MSVPTGLWELIDSQNYDAYLEAAGASTLYRHLMKTEKFNVKIKQEGNVYTLTTICTTNKVYPDHTMIFKLKEEIVEGTPDGRQCKSFFTMEQGNKLVQLQRCDKGNSKIVREFLADEMIMTLEVNGVTAKLTYWKPSD